MITIELRRLVQNNLLWDFDYDFYSDDEEIKKNFQKIFEQYYFFDEIGSETIGRFKQRLKTRLDLKAPYYKQLYKTELASKDIDFLLNKDYTETMKKINDGTSESDVSNESTGTSETNSNNNGNLKESNIDNGNGSVGLEQGMLTGVSNTTGNENSTSTSDSNSKSNQKIKSKNLEEYELIGKGNIGITSSAELLEKWREVLININEIILLDCRDLFMLVY